LTSPSLPAIIFADNKVEGAWFRGLSTGLKDASYVPIRRRGGNPPAVKALIVYDRPDIILVSQHDAVLVVEKTREVPTGHNVGQRLARLVRAAELKVPTIYFFPFDAKKHGTFANICHMNIRLLEAMESPPRISLRFRGP
jgi:hypothetical protein